jgi:hypothetical protein
LRAAGTRPASVPQISWRDDGKALRAAVEWGILPRGLAKTGSTGVLPKAAGKGNFYIRMTKKQEISSYFAGLIAIVQNKFLFNGSC